MSDTTHFRLPLLDAAQAQKHVTLNEALVRTDVLAAAVVESRSLAAPPPAPTDGTAYIVGAGASGAWAGEDGALALFLNGGWELVAPWAGCAVWIADEGVRAVNDGAGWVGGLTGSAASGAATLTAITEVDHVIGAGAVSTTAPVIPDKAVVLGVTGRVVEEITGAASWSLGVAGGPDRYGVGYGTAAGAFAHGVSGFPQAYYGGTELMLTADGGDFTGGRVRLAVHHLALVPPAPV